MNSFAGNLSSPPPTNLAQNTGFGGFQPAQDIVGQYAQLGLEAMPIASRNFQFSQANPYIGGALGGATGAANMGGTAATNQFNIGGAAAGAGLNLLPYAQPLLAAGFDPQSALYNRTAQQVQDQTRAGEAARGIAMTPYGAGVEGQTMSNFNIDWQNNLLSRMAQGAGAAGDLTRTGAGVMGQGAGLMSGAPNTLFSTAMLPYSTYQGIGGDMNQNLMALLGYGGSAQNLANVPTQNWLNLIQAGTGAQNAINNNFGNQLKQSQLGWGQLGQLGSGLGGLAGSLPFGSIMPSSAFMNNQWGW